MLVTQFDRGALARYGLTVGDAGRALTAAFRGERVSEVLEGRTAFDLVLRAGNPQPAGAIAQAAPASVAEILVDTPQGGRLPLKAVAVLQEKRSPNLISRENVQRKIVVMCNVAGRDLHSVVEDICRAVGRGLDLPRGYYVEYGGQFETAEKIARLLAILGTVIVLGIGFLLHVVFRSLGDAVLIMVNCRWRSSAASPGCTSPAAFCRSPRSSGSLPSSGLQRGTGSCWCRTFDTFSGTRA